MFLEPLFEGAPSAGYLNGGLVGAFVAPGFGGIARAVATPLGGVRARASREHSVMGFETLQLCYLHQLTLWPLQLKALAGI